MDFEEKLRRVNPELRPLVIRGRPQCNREYVYCECSILHAHKYTWYQAEVGGCLTCTKGSSRQKKARRYAEIKFGKVFQIMEDNLSTNFKSNSEKVILQFGAIDNLEDYDGYKVVDMRGLLLKKCRQMIRTAAKRAYDGCEVPEITTNPLFDAVEWDPYMDSLEHDIDSLSIV